MVSAPTMIAHLKQLRYNFSAAHYFVSSPQQYDCDADFCVARSSKCACYLGNTCAKCACYLGNTCAKCACYLGNTCASDTTVRLVRAVHVGIQLHKYIVYILISDYLF